MFRGLKVANTGCVHVQAVLSLSLILILNEIDVGYRYFPQENTQALVDGLFAQDQQKRLTSIRFTE